MHVKVYEMPEHSTAVCNTERWENSKKLSLRQLFSFNDDDSMIMRLTAETQSSRQKWNLKDWAFSCMWLATSGRCWMMLQKRLRPVQLFWIDVILMCFVKPTNAGLWPHWFSPQAPLCFSFVLQVSKCRPVTVSISKATANFSLKLLDW